MHLKALADGTFDDVGTRTTIPMDASRRPDDDVDPQGDQAVFADLYRVERPRLLRYFARRVGREDAHDLVQEAFASFMAAISCQKRRIDRPEAYLSTIAGNLVTKRGRTAARRSAALHISTDDVALSGADPQAHLEARDVLDRLETAMLCLRPMTREIFMAHRLDGYTYREIAERTGLSLKRVEKHMSRAIARLDDVLGTGS